MTHTSFLDVLFRSIPYSLAEIKWSLKAGMSLIVAMHPSTDMKQLITSGRTGTGDMFAGFFGFVFLFGWSVSDRSNHVCS